MCVILCGLSKISQVVWTDPISYSQFSSSVIIVSHVVDSDTVFDHNSDYLVQQQFCCRRQNPKMGYFLSLTRLLGGPVVFNLNFLYFFLYFLPFFFLFSKVWQLIFLTLICTFQPKISQWQDMAQLHCYNPQPCWNKRFLISQCRNEVSLNFLIIC